MFWIVLKILILPLEQAWCKDCEGLQGCCIRFLTCTPIIKLGIPDGGILSKLYTETETETWRPVVDDLNFDNIGVVESGLLEWRFEKEEILQVVCDMDGDKALGLDGFTMTFFNHCWRIVESDI